MQISVIIPTIGRDQALANTVKALLKQKAVEFEIIVVDQNRVMPREFGQFLNQAQENTWPVKRYRQGRPSASAARNLGLLAAKGMVVLFLDDDVIIGDDLFLAAHLSNYRDDGVAGVAGQILSPTGTVRQDRHAWSRNKTYGWLYFPLNYGARCVQPGVGGSSNLSVRREVALAVGGMDENFRRGAFREESDFIQRCLTRGYAFVYDPAASVVHLGEPTGGIRTWGRTRGARGAHHTVGEWYFIFRHATTYSVLHYLVAFLRNHFGRLDRRGAKHVWRALVAAYRGAVIARRLVIRPAKTLLTIDTRSRAQRLYVVQDESKRAHE